jgi:transcriptional regulator with XRE-family HTH domain
MSSVDCVTEADDSGGLKASVSGNGNGNGNGNGHRNGHYKAMQRLAAVRRLQGLSRRTVARRLNVEVAEIRRQEEQTSDLPLSILYRWQQALEVPISELLVESEDTLAQPLMQRAQLVRLMKTVLAILEQTDQEAVHLMAETLVEQLIETMPELRGVTAWHAVGKRRRLDELGVAAHRSLSDEIFVDLTE